MGILLAASLLAPAVAGAAERRSGIGLGSIPEIVLLVSIAVGIAFGTGSRTSD